MAKISVLVAVYNTEPYLRQCLDSLIAQTWKDIQVICVDDCSTDGSLSVLHEYARRDNRIEVLALPENGGQAHARNVGLGIATGDYVTFLDSDDWLAEDALQQMAAVFGAHPLTDTVLFKVMLCTGSPQSFAGSCYPMKPFDVLSGKEAFEKSLDWQIHGIYAARRSLYERYPYDDSCRAYSDDNTTRLHYYISREVRCCDGIYYYRQNPQSVTHKASVRRFDYLRANESMKRQLLQLGVGQSVIRQYENIRWRVLVDLYMFYHCHGHELSPQEQSYGKSELHRIWDGIDRSLLESGLTCKLGYRPMKSWRMFCFQEWVYFTLRGWFGKNQ